MRRLSLITVAIVAMTLLLVACGGGGAEAPAGPPSGDPARGEELYTSTTIGSASAPGCVTCHSLEEGVVLVGPSHIGVATRAQTAEPGLSAEEYLRQSIREPDAHVTEGFVAGVMYQNYATDLSARDINDLVAFLMTLQ